MTLHHLKDIEKLDNFREQMGEDWLRYQHHLHGKPALVSSPTVAQVIAEQNCTPSSQLNKIDLTMPRLASLPVQLLSSESKTEEDILDFQPETESTLDWTAHSYVDIESTLKTSQGNPQPQEKACTDLAFGEVEEDLGGLCGT